MDESVANEVALLLDPATGKPYPEHVQRELNRYIKKGALNDILASVGAGDSAFFVQLVRYSVSMAVTEDEDLAPLEQHRKLLVAFGRKLLGMPDALAKLPWTRIPRCWGWNGTLANLTGGESRVLLGLCTLVDPKSLSTTATIETIGALIDRSWDRTRDNLRGLKKKRVIERWPIKHPNPNDPYHFLWITRLNTESMTEEEYRARAGPNDELAGLVGTVGSS